MQRTLVWLILVPVLFVPSARIQQPSTLSYTRVQSALRHRRCTGGELACNMAGGGRFMKRFVLNSTPFMMGDQIVHTRITTIQAG